MDFLQSYHLNHHHKNIQKHLYNYTFALLNELKFIMDSSASLTEKEIRFCYKSLINLIQMRKWSLNNPRQAGRSPDEGG